MAVPSTKDLYLTLPQIWDLCLKKIYNAEVYVSGLEGVFKQIGITKDSSILDAACGSGFPVLELIKRGYRVEGTDKNDEMIHQVRDNARKARIEISAQQATWSTLPTILETKFDLIMCRGNSLVYAYSWERNWIVPKRSFDEITASLKGFYQILKSGGFLYVDVTHKSEQPHRESLGTITVDKTNYQLVWEVQHDVTNRIRTWMVELKNILNDEIRKYPSYSYLFKPGELERLLQSTGFKDVKEIEVEGEQNYTVYIAHK